jgi:hypothetical protein
MDQRGLWSRVLAVAGLIGMVVGAIDPLEGSLVILPAIGLVGLGAFLGKSRHRLLAYWALVLVVVGVGTMFGLSAFGGVGGDTGRSMWWALVIVPYPVGWIMGMVGGIRSLLELFRRPAEEGLHDGRHGTT